MTSVGDLAANTIGCLFGGYLCALLSRYFDRDKLGALILELPSFNLLYLLVPLLWLVHLSETNAIREQVLAFPLCLTGAIVIGGLWRYRIGPHAQSAPFKIAALAAGWFSIAAFFSFQNGLLWSLGLGASFALLVWLIPRLPSQQLRRGKRFEPVVLGAALLFLCLFQALAASWPMDGFFSSFAATTGWPNFFVR